MRKNNLIMVLTVLMISTLITPVFANWQAVDYSNPDDIMENGLSLKTFNNISKKDWLSILGNEDNVNFSFRVLDSKGNDVTHKINPNLRIDIFGNNGTGSGNFPNYDNEAPRFVNNKKSITIKETDLFKYQLIAKDINKDNLTYKLTNINELPEKLTINNGLIKWQTDYLSEGKYALKASVYDGEYSDTTSIKLIVEHKNAPPVLNSLNTQFVNENELLEFNITASDLDEDILTFNSDNLPKGANLLENGQISWQPNYLQSGVHKFTVSVTDGINIDSKEYTVRVNDVNVAPTIEDIPNQSINENEIFKYQIEANDIDNDNLTYSIKNKNELPKGLNINNDGLVHWETNFKNEGSYNIEIEISDNKFSTIKVLRLTVNHVNAPPLLNNLDIQIVNENELLEFNIAASDLDKDILTFSSNNLPEGANLTEKGKFNWKPNYLQAGIYDFNVKVTDGIDIDSKVFSIQVNDVNAAPIIKEISDQVINENDLFTYQVKASDIDGDKLIYSIVNINELPEGISINEKGLIKWKTNYYSQGDYNIKIKVSDGELSSVCSFNLSVNWYNQKKTYLYFNGSQGETGTRVSSSLLYNNNSYFELEIELYMKEPQGNFVPLIGSAMGNNIDSGLKISGRKIMFHDYGTFGVDKDTARTGNILTLNEWQKVKLIYDNGNVKLYRNNKLVSTGYLKTIPSGTLIIGAPRSFHSCKNRRFKGYLRNAVIRNRSSILGQYSLQDKTGNTAKDQTGRNHGSIINHSWKKNYIYHDDYNLN